MFPVLLSLALYEPTLLPGGGVALPNSLGTLVSTFSGRAFGADAPGAGSSLGAAGENAFAVVVPDADCE